MGRRYVGNHVCLITKGKGSTQSKNGVIVIAHGAKLPNKSFAMEGGTFWFYCPDGAVLLDNLYDFMRSQIVSNVYEKLVGTGTKKCPDYELSKCVSYHVNDASRALGKKGVKKALKANPVEAENDELSTYEYWEKLIDKGECLYDIASIRNRWFSDGTTLSNVVKMLRKHGYGYGNIHCHFCRESDDNGRDWDLEFKTYV